MRSFILPAFVGLLLTAAPVLAEFHPDARRAYEEHWRSHPEHADAMVRQWHQRLFHREVPAHLLTRWAEELRRGIAAPLAVAHILGSAEFYLTCGSTPEGFVRTTFQEIVGRRPTEPEFHFWVTRLYHSDRAVVAQEMVTRYPPPWIAEEPAAVVPTYEYRTPVATYRR